MKQAYVQSLLVGLLAASFSMGCVSSADGGLVVRRQSKVFANDAERARCGGDYDVTVWIDADERAGRPIYVREVTFGADTAREIAHATALEIAAGGRPIERFTQPIVRTDERGRTFVTFSVHRAFTDAEVSLRHVVAPASIAVPAGARADRELLARCGLTVATTIAPEGGP